MAVTQAASTSNPLSAFERMRHWWRRLAASVFPGRDAAGADRATTRLVERLKGLLDESRARRGGEISARARAAEIAALYRGADLPQRAAALNLITH